MSSIDKVYGVQQAFLCSHSSCRPRLSLLTPSITLQMIIKGIRSFSPDNQNSITFFKPLTLIVGHNGAGKTVSLLVLSFPCHPPLRAPPPSPPFPQPTRTPPCTRP